MFFGFISGSTMDPRKSIGDDIRKFSQLQLVGIAYIVCEVSDS